MTHAVASGMRAAGLILLPLVVNSCSAPCDGENRDCNGTCVSPGELTVIPCGQGSRCVLCSDRHPQYATSTCAEERPDGTGICGFTCYRGFGDCNHNPADGCETNLMDDANNCGGCGIVCHGTCTPAGCLETLADGESSATGLVADHARAYWASRASGPLEVRTAEDPLASAQVLARVDAGAGLPPTLALGSGQLFLATGSSDGGGAIVAIPTDGGTPSTVAAGRNEPARVTVDGDAVYWTDHGSGLVMRASPGQGPFVLASGRNHPLDIAVDAGTMYWLEEGGAPAIFALAPGTGAPAQITAAADVPTNLVVDLGGVYWSDNTSATLVLLPWGAQRIGYPQSGPWNITSIVGGREAGALFGDSARHVIGNWQQCDLVSGETNPEWLAVGRSPETKLTDGGGHIFWIEGARIRRLSMTTVQRWGDWCR